MSTRPGRLGASAVSTGAPPRGQAPRAWWLVLKKELRDLWVGGKALNLTLAYCVVLGIYAYSMIQDTTLSLEPPKEMVFEVLKVAIAACLFICLILGADSISGERERATLEPLLLAPVSRRQIVIGKLLAATSPWPAAFVLTIPYWVVLAQGDEVFGQTLVWGALVGSLMAPALAGIGMLVSLRCSSNKTSLFVSLGVYLFLLLPTQLPGTLQTGAVGAMIQQVTPMAATTHFLAKILVNNSTFAIMWPWFASPALLAILVVTPLILLSARGLGIEPRKGGWLRSYWRNLSGVSGVTVLALALQAAPARALQEPSAGAGGPPATASGLGITIDLGAVVVKAGDPVLFNTVLTNSGSESSPPLTVAMNIINLDARGDVVDPEDWSPQRTQYLEQLAPGESSSLAWRVNAILAGDYMVYMVVIPRPAGQDATSQPVASSGIHLTVTPFTRLNPGGVLPYAIGVPILLLLGIVFLYRYRNRQIDAGGAS
jgi:ABC-2 type transport system permease protein